MPTLHNRSRFALSIAFMAIAANAEGAPKAQQPVDILIAPGASREVDAETWGKVSKQPSVNDWRKAGMLEVTDGKATLPQRVPSGPMDLSTLNEAEACEMVVLVESVDELKVLRDLDARKKVRAAIAKRLRDLGA